MNHDTLYQRTWSGNQTKVIVVCFCSVCALGRLKFDRVFVALSPAIFTLCVSLLPAWSLIAVSIWKNKRIGKCVTGSGNILRDLERYEGLEKLKWIDRGTF